MAPFAEARIVNKGRVCLAEELAKTREQRRQTTRSSTGGVPSCKEAPPSGRPTFGYEAESCCRGHASHENQARLSIKGVRFRKGGVI